MIVIFAMTIIANNPSKAESNAISQGTEQSKLEHEIRLLDLVKQSPEAFETLNDIGLSEWEIAKIKSESGVQLNASTSGGYRIASNLPRTHRKYSQEDGFVDLALNVSKRLYDAGVASARIEAESNRKLAKILEYNKVLRNSFFTALRLGYLAISAEEQITNIERAITAVRSHRKKEEKRYRSGTGTSANLKELDLLAIELITDKQVKNLELQNHLTDFKNRFDANLSDYLLDIKEHEFIEIREEFEEIVHALDAMQTFDFQLAALDEEIISSERQNKPQLTLNITTNIYDIESDKLQNYEVNGGLNLNIPIFDSGVQKNNVRALATRKNIIKHQRQKEVERLLTASQNVKDEIENSASKIEAINFKIDQIKQKLIQLNLRSSNMVASGLEIAKSEYRVFQLEREQMRLNWNMTLAEAEKALLNETLVSEL